jgi:DNA-binding MarR family transcriptional regulator
VSITRIVRALAERELIYTEKDPDDLRSFKASLTPSGKYFVENLRPKSEKIAQGIIERFGEENATQLLDLLNMLSRINDNGP